MSIHVPIPIVYRWGGGGPQDDQDALLNGYNATTGVAHMKQVTTVLLVALMTHSKHMCTETRRLVVLSHPSHHPLHTHNTTTF